MEGKKTLKKAKKGDSAGIAAELKGLRNGQEDLRKGQVVLSKDVGELKKDVSGLKQDVSGLKQCVSGLKQDVGGLKQDVDVLKMDVVSLKKGQEVIVKDTTEMRSGLARLQMSHIEFNAKMHESFRKTDEQIKSVRNEVMTALDEMSGMLKTQDEECHATFFRTGELQKTVDRHEGDIKIIKGKLQIA